MKQLRVFSYGGGVQSNAVLALQALGGLEEPYDVFAFANVGADSENPATLEYVETVAKPFAARHGIELQEVRRTRRDGTTQTLREVMDSEKKSVVVPAFVTTTREVRRLRRNCTHDFKVLVVDDLVKAAGATHAVVGLGISLDEYTRVRSEDWYDREGSYRLGFMKRREYPLITLRMTREDCKALIASVDLPEPPKSSCFFCPFKSANEWIEFKRDEPELFAQAVAIEQRLNEKETPVKGRIFLHRSGTPLQNAVGEQARLFADDPMDVCESGYCMV